ncbi:MAG: transcription elongation factor GreA [Clostridia bacterium]|nr:transcription elongation factor GreA [Clostridia bacterium]
MSKQVIVTETGYQKMKEELDYLKNVKRKEAAEAVGVARSFGDLSENSEYDEAKNEQGKIELKIHELEEMLNHAKIISDHEIQTDVVNIGVTVKLHDVEYDEDIVYNIVSSREVNVKENKISDQSPIGKALIGAKVGDTVTVEVPDGTIKFKVLEIEKQDD